MRISRLTVDSLTSGCVTDEAPRFGFALESDLPGEALDTATITVGDWTVQTTEQTGMVYAGPLAPRTAYAVEVAATGTSGTVARAQASFRTGRLGLPWAGEWITDGAYETPEKQSPVPMVFRRGIPVRPGLVRAWAEITALGVYELTLNGAKVGEDYFAPGFTSYAHQIQYQTYELDPMVGENLVEVTVAGGWAVGSFTHKRKNKIYADRQALLGEIHLAYDDGTVQVIPTGIDWEVSTDGPYRMAEWYDGETYDATVTDAQRIWRAATVTRPQGEPRLLAQYGAPVRVQRVFTPVEQTTAPSGETVYDFGQNFAGVIRASVRGSAGQTITFRHAEVLVDGELFV